MNLMEAKRFYNITQKSFFRILLEKNLKGSKYIPVNRTRLK